MRSPLLFKEFSALAVLHIVQVRFGEEEGTMANPFRMEEHGVDGETNPMNGVRQMAWGRLYADHASVEFKSSEGLTKMVTVIVTIYEKAGVTYNMRKLEP